MLPRFRWWMYGSSITVALSLCVRSLLFTRHRVQTSCSRFVGGLPLLSTVAKSSLGNSPVNAVRSQVKVLCIAGSRYGGERYAACQDQSQYERSTNLTAYCAGLDMLDGHVRHLLFKVIL